jgi:hypothetical protein
MLQRLLTLQIESKLDVFPLARVCMAIIQRSVAFLLAFILLLPDGSAHSNGW